MIVGIVRFLTRGNALSINAYSYNLNNPVKASPYVAADLQLKGFLSAFDPRSLLGILDAPEQIIGSVQSEGLLFTSGALAEGVISSHFAWLTTDDPHERGESLGNLALALATRGGSSGKGAATKSLASLSNAAESGISVTKKAAAGGKITGYTRHGTHQAISRTVGKGKNEKQRGVAASAILDAVKNPKRVVSQEDGVTRYIGGQAQVRLNQNGQIITVFPKSSDYYRIK